jgi:hypothetical protein
VKDFREFIREMRAEARVAGFDSQPGGPFPAGFRRAIMRANSRADFRGGKGDRVFALAGIGWHGIAAAYVKARTVCGWMARLRAGGGADEAGRPPGLVPRPVRGLDK